jgi:hypothetical protein
VQTIQASEFQAKCLALVDGVASTGDVLVIVAAALRHDAQLITADAAILGWTGELRRLDARA